MMNPTTPCGAMTRPVNSGDSCKTCCRYSERTSSSPPFHRPSRNVSVVPSRSPLRCSSDRRMSGSGCLASALAKAAVAAAAITTAAMTSGEVQPSTTPLGHGEHDERDRAGDQQRAAHVEPVPGPRCWRPRSGRDRLTGRLRCGPGGAEDGRGQGGGDQADRDVDQEHRAPAGELHQHAAEHLAGDEADGGDRTVQADGASTLGAFGEAGGDERQRGRGDDGGARALHDARGDQQHWVLGQPAGQAGQRERDQARDEHAPPAEQVSGPAAEDEKAAERDGVSRHHPLHRIGGHMQFALNRGQRDVHDAEIEDDHERGDEDQGQLQRPAAGRAGVGRAAAARRRRWPGGGRCAGSRAAGRMVAGSMGGSGRLEA